MMWYLWCNQTILLEAPPAEAAAVTVVAGAVESSVAPISGDSTAAPAAPVAPEVASEAAPVAAGGK